MLRFLHRVVTIVGASPVKLGVCGEMGGKPLEAMTLLGLGITRLSITPAGIGPVKAMIHSLNLEKLRQFMPSLLEKPPAKPRAVLLQWAQDNDVDLSS